MAAKDIRDLRRSIYDIGKRVPELLPYILYLIFSVLGNVMKERAGNGDIVQRDFPGKNDCSFEGMVEKRFSGSAEVVAMGVETELESSADQVFINFRKVFSARNEEIVKL